MVDRPVNITSNSSPNSLTVPLERSMAAGPQLRLPPQVDMPGRLSMPTSHRRA